MKIKYKIVTEIGSLEHSFNDEKLLVKGFQELEDMLGTEPETIPRMVLLVRYMVDNGLWNKKYDDFFITDIKRIDDSEYWLFTKTLN
jgi:hypothetical protein